MRQRLRIILTCVVVATVALGGRLAWVQLVWGPDLAAKAVTQRERVYIDPARRGEILDRDGQRLAYTMKSRSLTVSPTRLRDELKEQAKMEATSEGKLEGMDESKKDEYLTKQMEDKLKEMAEGIPKMIEDSGASASKVDANDIKNKLKADTQYEVLVRNVDPDVAVEISNKYHGVAADRQDIRQYPNGAIAENVVGKVSMDGHGQFGFEAARDTELTGIDGQSTEDVSTDGQVIPGTLRDVVDAVDGRVLFQRNRARLNAMMRGEPDPGADTNLGDIVVVPPVKRARDEGLLKASPMFSSLDEVEADHLIWCTGFRPALGPFRTLLDGRTPTVEGLFLVGYGTWTGPGSATITGVSPFAKQTAGDIAKLCSPDL